MTIDDELVINTQLAGVPQFLAGAAAEAEAIRKVEGATTGAGKAMEGTAKRGFIMNQALFTMRRFVYSGTLALTGLAAASLGMGIAFNANMEMQTVALTHFLGSTQAATAELDHLYNVAAKTPFEFAQVTDAARRFLAFGFTLRETNKYLDILGDTAAGLALDKTGMSRLAIVFGQIRATGRVLGGDLLQLAQAGIPAIEILRKKLGLTRAEIAKGIGSLNIPASVAIPALMEGLQERFRGAAREQSRTLTGQISTLKDYTQQLLGTISYGVFDNLRKNLIPRLSGLVGDMQRAANPKTGGSFHAAIVALDRDLTPRSGRVLRLWNNMAGIATDLRTVILALGAAFLHTKAVIVAILAPFIILRGVLFVLAHTTKIWVPILEVLLTFLVPYVIWVKAAAFWTKMWRKESVATQAVNKAGIAIEKAMNAVMWIRLQRTILLTKAIRLWRVATLGYLLVDGKFTKMTAFEKFVLGMRFKVLALRASVIRLIAATRLWAATTTAILFTTPVGWIILAIALVIGGLIILYIKWKRFHDAVNSLFQFFFKSSSPLAMAIRLAFGPLGIVLNMILLIIKNWERLVRLWDRFKSFFGGGGAANPATAPVTRPVTTLAPVETPVTRQAPTAGDGGVLARSPLKPLYPSADAGKQEFHLYIDGDEINTRVAKKRSDKRARR